MLDVCKVREVILQAQISLYCNVWDQNNNWPSILVQERLTKQIAEAMQEAVSPRGVAVVIEAMYVWKK